MTRKETGRFPPSDETPGPDAPAAVHRQELSRFILRALSQRGWTQSEFARRAGLGRDLISTYVRGRALPTRRSLDAMAQALGVEPEELLPAVERARHDDETPALEIRQAVGHPDKVWLRVSQRVDYETAVEVMRVLHGRGGDHGDTADAR